MSDERPVAWIEGMFLRPQHFQQQDRYFSAALRDRTYGLTPYSWGVREIAIDRSLAEAGRFALTKCAGVFQDGTPFRFPGQDAAPPPVVLPPALKDATVYLTLPVRDLRGRGFGFAQSQGGDVQRYQIVDATVEDSVDQASEPVTIQVGRMALGFSDSAKDRSGLLSIPIASVKEIRPDGAIVFEERFIATCMLSSASNTLVSYLAEVRAMLEGLCERLAGRGGQVGAAGMGAMRDLFELSVLNRYALLFAHLSSVPELHPEALYRYFISMIGELATFDRERRALLKPNYIHENLQLSFEPIMDALNRLLTRIREQKAIAIPLRQNEQFRVTMGQVRDRALLDTGSFIVVVRAAVEAAKLVESFPNRTKVGALIEIRRFIDGAMAGIPLRYLPAAPTDLPRQAGWQYFEIDRTNPLWSSVVDERNNGVIAFHFDHKLPEFEIQLWGIRGD